MVEKLLYLKRNIGLQSENVNFFIYCEQHFYYVFLLVSVITCKGIIFLSIDEEKLAYGKQT